MLASAFQRTFAPLYERWRQNILVFAEEALNRKPGTLTELTDQQIEACELVQLETLLPYHLRKQRIAIKSGQGNGKTLLTVIIALWRLLRHVDALVIVTSPSMRQCKQWIDECKRVLRDAHPAIQALFECFETKVEVGGRSLWAIKTATATRPENLQGIHDQHLIFIVDEASGVKDSIIETIQGTLSNPDSLFIQIGNPNTTACKFYECFTSQRDLWHCLTFDSEHTAANYPHILSPKRNELIAREYGKDSDMYRIRVKGEFPVQDPSSIMSIEDLQACTKTSRVGCAGISDILPSYRAIGIDLARFGGDDSVIAVRQGLAIIHYRAFQKVDPNIVVEEAFVKQQELGWRNEDVWYVPDAGGLGQGVMHNFHRAKKLTLEFHTQSRPKDSSMFADRYSEAWFNLRYLTRERIVHIPNDVRLLKQLSTRQYVVDKKGKIKVESKDEWKKRMEVTESPDRADAIVMAFYQVGGKGGEVVRVKGWTRTVGKMLDPKGS